MSMLTELMLSAGLDRRTADVDVVYAGAVLLVTAEGRCIIKVFPPEEDAIGPDVTNSQPTSVQVLLPPQRLTPSVISLVSLLTLWA